MIVSDLYHHICFIITYYDAEFQCIHGCKTVNGLECVSAGLFQARARLQAWPAGKPITLKMRSSWSWWKGLLVLMSSWRQWNIGSDVSSSAKIQPIAQMSALQQKQTIITTINNNHHHNSSNTTQFILSLWFKPFNWKYNHKITSSASQKEKTVENITGSDTTDSKVAVQK